MAEERVNYDDVEESVKKLKEIAEGLEDTNNKITKALEFTDEWEGDAADAYKEAVTDFLNQGNYLSEASKTIASAGLFLMAASDAYKETESEIGKELKKLLGGQDEIDKMDVSSFPDVDVNSRVEDNFPDPEPEPEPEPNTGPGYEPGGPPSTPYSYSDGGSGSGVVTTVSSATPAVTPLKPGEKVEDLDKIEQDTEVNSPYSILEYDDGSPESLIEKAWKEQGSKYKNGIASIEVEDEDRYLVKVSESYGKVGDAIDVTLDDNTTIKCIIAETEKSTTDSVYGKQTSDGKVNVLEFKTNPKAEKIDYSWNTDSKVTEITHKGSIMNSVKQSQSSSDSASIKESIESTIQDAVTTDKATVTATINDAQSTTTDTVETTATSDIGTQE